MEVHREEVVELVKEEEVVIKPAERPVEQFRKFDPSSPAKPTPKHLQRHMRNESMRFPSGDFSNVTITPRKSVTAETSEIKTVETKTDTFKDTISQKEIDSSRVEEKMDDRDRSPDLVDDRDTAELPLREKISTFESKLSKESCIEFPKTTMKLTKEALKKHTLEQDQGIEYTQEFVREQSKQISSMDIQEHVIHKISHVNETHIETHVKSVKDTIQQFDSKIKQEDKTKTYPKTMRTDSTLVQVSSEEDSEFLKKSTDSETETESQTTVKVERDGMKSKIPRFVGDVFESKDKDDKRKKTIDTDKQNGTISVEVKERKLEKQMTDELRTKVSEEDITETLEEKGVSVKDTIKEKVMFYTYVSEVLNSLIVFKYIKK